MSPIGGSIGADLPPPALTERTLEQLNWRGSPKHIIIIVQENRSFDHYFGTFPGADGFPMRQGRINVCIPDPILETCSRPYHTSSQLQQGGPHAQRHSREDVNNGRMDGFIEAAVDA
jgi:phospholipase C